MNNLKILRLKDIQEICCVGKTKALQMHKEIKYENEIKQITLYHLEKYLIGTD